MNNGLPPEVCVQDSPAWQYGFYRKLNTGKYEFISFCDERAKLWLAMYKDDAERLLNATLPEQ